MTVVHLAVADDDVLRGATGKGSLTALTTVVVATRLDSNAVVAGIEVAVLYQYAVTRLRVAAVTVRTIVVDVYATHGDVGGQQGMDNPERRTQQGDVLYQNAFALVEVDELWAQAVLLGEAALVHGYSVFSRLEQTRSAGFFPLVNRHALLESELRRTDPRPPSLT